MDSVAKFQYSGKPRNTTCTINKKMGRTIKWKQLTTRKRLLSLSLVVVATLATIFAFYAIMHTTTPPTSAGTSIPALPANTDGGDILQAFGGTDSGTPADNFTRNQIAGNSQARQNRGRTGFGTVLYDGSLPTQLADDSDADSSPATNANQVVHGSDGKGSDRPPDDFTPILLANNAYPKYDYDFRAIESGGGVGQGTESTASDTSPGSVDNEPRSHVPEPASMLLLGSALVGVAVFGRKLKKT